MFSLIRIKIGIRAAINTSFKKLKVSHGRHCFVWLSVYPHIHIWIAVLSCLSTYPIHDRQHMDHFPTAYKVLLSVVLEFMSKKSPFFRAILSSFAMACWRSHVHSCCILYFSIFNVKINSCNIKRLNVRIWRKSFDQCQQ